MLDRVLSKVHVFHGKARAVVKLSQTQSSPARFALNKDPHYLPTRPKADYSPNSPPP
jgi:hypothetical protein